MDGRLIIEGVDGFLRGKRFVFSKDSVCLGTDASCDVRLDPVWDKSVGARHVLVRWDGSQWFLEDLGRRTTLIEGRSVQSQVLESETTIQLGQGGPKFRIVLVRPPEVVAVDLKGAERETTRASSKARLIGVVVFLLLLGCAALAWNYRNLISARLAGVFHKVLPEVAEEVNAQSGQMQIVMEMGDQLFPSYLIASAAMRESHFDEMNAQDSLRLGDKRGVVGVELFNPVAGTPVRVEVEENEMIRASGFEGVMLQGGTRYRIYPSINYRYEVLAGVRQTTPLSFSVKVQIGDGPKISLSRPVRVASVNSCPFQIKDLSGVAKSRFIDMRWMFAAYVNENHPISDEIRLEALKHGIVEYFIGYQGSEEEVFLQVFALWNALQRRGVKYSSITSTPSPTGPVSSQYVRFLDQSVNNSQANCVDGTVLFASLLRQIGVEPILVFTSDHMLLGFELDPAGEQVVYLETTCIGTSPSGSTEYQNQIAGFAGSAGDNRSKFSKARTIRIGQKKEALQSVLGRAMLQDVDLKTSLQSFWFAVSTGMRIVEEAFGDETDASNLTQAKLRRGNGGAAKPSRQNFCEISIEEAREMGVLPIAYKY